MKKVVLINYRLFHYRMELLNQLRQACADKNIALHLVHGQPTKRELQKKDVGFLPWADVVVNRYVSIGGKDILWQPYPSQHRDADLVVLMQENRLVSNYPWLFLRAWHKTRLAYWGHGRNFQAENADGWRERWKRFLIGRVDWWFAYTDITKNILLADGFPESRITVLNNAIDNENFQRDLTAIDATRLAGLRHELDLSAESQVGLFCGSLYADKRLDYMLAAADQIRLALPDFHLIVVGDGPNGHEMREAAKTRPWLHCVGVRKGLEKAAYFLLADVVINPGLVGLHVLDAFCAGVPMVTTAEARHSPEVAYLKDSVNGLVVSGDASAYAEAVIRLLSAPDDYRQLQAAARADADHYTLHNMVLNFATGIEQCLAMERKA